MQNSTTINCKVCCDNQIRRFSFTGAEFSSLKQQIQNLFNLQGEFVLKYLDNESDLITLSTNEELVLAIEYSDKLLRLTIVTDNVSSNLPAIPVVFAPAGPHFSHCGENNYHRHHPHGRGKRGSCGRRCSSERWQGKRVHLMMKLDSLKSWLSQYPEEASQLTPRQQDRKQQVVAKIRSLESHLAQWDVRKEMKCKKHEEKLRQKSERCKHKKNLSPETMEQIRVLKEQIKTLKPAKKQIKSELHRRKFELEGTVTDENVGTYWEEIQVLQQKLDSLKTQIGPLKHKIRELKYGQA